MFQLIMMVIATIGVVYFLLLMKQSSDYDEYLESLNNNDYPLHEVYGVGYKLSEKKRFSIPQEIYQNMYADALILTNREMAESQVMLQWAGLLGTVSFITVLMLVLIGVNPRDAFMYVIAFGALGYCMVKKMLDGLHSRVEEQNAICEKKLPEVISTMAILVNSGMMLRDAWSVIAESDDTVLHLKMRKVSDLIKNGMSEQDALYSFSAEIDSGVTKKFISALIQCLDKGGDELEIFLTNQSSFMWNTKRQIMLQEGEKSATKLLVPVLLMFVGILMIIMTSVFSSIGF